MLSTVREHPEVPGSTLEAGAGAGAAHPGGAHQGVSGKPFDLEFISISRREHIELKLQASQYRCNSPTSTVIAPRSTPLQHLT